MRLFPWLRNPARPAPARKPAGFRPRLEALDDRSLPSAVGFSTVLSSKFRGVGTGSAVNAAGDVYVSVYTGNQNGNTTTGNVYEFSPTGKLLASSASILGAGAGIALDPEGDVYAHSGAVVTELDPTLQNTLFTVTIPGVNHEGNGYLSAGTSPNGAIAVAGGKIYVVGGPGAGLPTTANAYQTAYPGAATGLNSAFVAVIDPTSTAPYFLTYCTYLGGPTVTANNGAGTMRGGTASGVAVDAAGNVYLTGTTDAADFPTTAGAFRSTFVPVANPYNPDLGYGHTYVTELSADGSHLLYSTFLGANGATGQGDGGEGIVVDAAGDAWVTGWTRSTSFPVTAGAVQGQKGNGSDGNGVPNSNAFVVELNPTGSAELYGTYWGGTSDDYGLGIALDGSGDVIVAGQVATGNFPTTKGAYLKSGYGFLMKFTP